MSWIGVAMDAAFVLLLRLIVRRTRQGHEARPRLRGRAYRDALV